MKLILCSIIAFFSLSTLLGQTTVQFEQPLPPGKPTIQGVDKSLYGRYKSTNSETTYCFDEQGIAIVSIITAFVTHEQVRESSALEVRNDFLFGIKAGDSVPCFFENDKYYYGIEHRQPLIGNSSNNQLVALDGQHYILNFKEGNNYEPSLFEFQNGSLTVKHAELEYQQEYKSVNKQSNIDRYGTKVAVLNPKQNEWTKMNAKIFDTKQLKYVKELQ